MNHYTELSMQDLENIPVEPEEKRVTMHRAIGAIGTGNSNPPSPAKRQRTS